MTRPGVDTLCPAVCGELGSRVVFLALLHDFLEGIHSGKPTSSAHAKVWERLTDAASDITILSANSGLYPLLKEKAVGVAFRQFRPTLEALAGADAADDMHDALSRTADGLLVSRTDCVGCRSNAQSVGAYLSAEDAKKSICTQPVFEIFTASRIFADELMKEWGLDEFPAWSRAYALEFLTDERPASPPLTIDPEQSQITVRTGVNRFDLTGYLRLAFSFFHELVGHAATRLTSPSSFCDDFGLRWQKEVYLARHSLGDRHYHAIATIHEGMLKEPFGFSAEGTDAALGLKHSVVRYLAPKTDLHKAAVGSLAWDLVGKLAIAAAHVHGERVSENFVQPLYTGLDRHNRARFEPTLWDAFDTYVLTEVNAPIARFRSLVTSLHETWSDDGYF